MNIVTILTAVAVIGVSIFTLEGLNLASGGEFYLASIQNLAENSAPLTNYLQAADETTTNTASTVVTDTTATTPATPTSDSAASGGAIPTTSSGTINQPLMPIQQVGQQIMQPGCASGTTCDQNQNKTRQEIRNSGDNNQIIEMEDNQQDFVDPKEIQRTLKEIANMRSEIKRVITQNKKTASASDIAELNAILAEANKSYTAIKSADSSEARSVMQDFFDGQYWEKIQAVRTRLEIPKELKQMAPIFKRLEKTLSTKAIQNIGLDIEKAKLGVAEMKQLADKIQTAYNAGDMETAQEAMQELRDNGGHPGEIEGTIFRFRDIKNLLKKVKDEQVRSEVDGVLQEVVDAFNSGDYREANQTMNEYTDDLQKLINTFIKSKISNKNRADSMNKIQNLENLIQSKLGTETQQQTQTTQP